MEIETIQFLYQAIEERLYKERAKLLTDIYLAGLGKAEFEEKYPSREHAFDYAIQRSDELLEELESTHEAALNHLKILDKHNIIFR